MRFIFLTMDGTQNAALREAAAGLQRDYGITLELSLYNAPSLRSAADWQRLSDDAARADFIFGARLFGEDLVRPLERILLATSCPICVVTSNPALIRCTRLGKFVLHKPDEEQEPGLWQQLIRKFRPKGGMSEAKRQLAFLRNLGKVLKFIPGKARDLYTFIVAHQYWVDSSTENMRRLLCMLIDRYVPGYSGRLPVQDPVSYPEAALFHPDAPQPFAELSPYIQWLRSRNSKLRKNNPVQGVVGLLSLRTTALSGNTAHLDALLRALEARGIDVRMAYGSGLDFRPVIDQFFMPKEERRKAKAADLSSSVDLLINGTGFSLVGGPAESRPDEARVALEGLDVGYLDMIPLSFQRVDDWRNDDTGLTPIQLALNVAIPELDGAAEPLVYGGPVLGSDAFVALPDMVEVAANRIARRVGLHRKPNAAKKVAIAVFSFPPTLGNIGTAAYLDVFASLYRLLQELKANGYSVELPASVEALRDAVVGGNANVHGTDGNVAARLPVNDYRRLCLYYADIEPFWGPAPGELLNNGKEFYILGRQFGNVFVGIQPGFGYERDPMRLLMAKDAAPHHGFAAFYTWIDRVFAADAVVHFGTHGALEFMPGKQVGLSSSCWPTRLIGGLPNFYYYSVNNPSEATIAKRRGLATTISYLVPPLHQAGLYKGLRLLKDSIDTYRQHPTPELLEDIRAQAERLQIGDCSVQRADDDAQASSEEYIAALAHELLQIEQRMIPLGLHVLGQPPAVAELVDFLVLAATFHSIDEGRKGKDQSRAASGAARPSTLPAIVAAGMGWDYEELRTQLRYSREAQERWEKIEATCREAMRRFVSSELGALSVDATQPGPSSKLKTQHSGEAYLQEVANIRPGTLTALWAFLGDLAERIVHDGEIKGLLHALDGGYVSPSPANDVVRNPAVVPTGRNVHSLDPYRIPSTMAMDAGKRLVVELLEQLTREQGTLPESVAIVLWGTDNLKSDGEGVAQVLALLGARTVHDELGNVSDIALIPLAELGRPRVDVVVTVSGIFRDLLFHQMELLDKAARLAACADEPVEFNFVRKHALAQAVEMGVSVEDAATRIFANAPGSYGANVSRLVESSTWEDEGQLSEAFLSRKSFSVGQGGQWRDSRAIMEKALATVDATFQNIDSFEVGISDIDNYYENLGGMTKSVELLRGKRPPVMVADAVATSGRLSSLEQMVRLETRAKLLNPKWYESMLAHGFEGAREIESRVNNTYGWSTTTNAVEGWVYQGVAETFVLDEAMRDRLAKLNPHAAAGMVRRLLEANGRGFWDADPETLEKLRDIYDDLEDRLEGVLDKVTG